MAAYKSEFLAQHYKGRLHPIHHYIFGFADRLAQYGSLAPGITNAILTGSSTSPFIKHVVGIARERRLPRLAAKSYQKARSTAQTKGSAELGAPGLDSETWEIKGESRPGGALMARHLEHLLPSPNAHSG